MSSHLWMTQERAAVLSGLLNVQAREVREVADEVPGGGAEDLRSQLLACSGALARCAELLSAGDGPVRLDTGRTEQRREIGARTLQKIQHFGPNRGPA